MGNRLSKIYTKTGDDGTSGLGDGSRISKADAVFGAMGDVDELNSHLGMILALLAEDDLSHQEKSTIVHALTVIQHLLFNLGGELAMPEFVGITPAHVTWLEHTIDKMNATLPYLKDFILPKGSVLISQIHIARSVARRAERACVLLLDSPTPIKPHALQFINRLSDYLFVLARFVTPTDTVTETLWDAQLLDSLSQQTPKT